MTNARARLGNSKLISPAARDWFVAMLYVAKGDRASYQAACRDALDKISSEPDLDERGALLWMCTVTPYAVADPSQLAEYADEVLPPGEGAPSSDSLLAVGAAFYRAGKWPEAQLRLEQALRLYRDKKPTVDPMSEIYAHQFLAMTNLRLGLADKAQAHLADADRLAKTIRPPCWVSKLEHKLLTAETRDIIDSSDSRGKR
jgi:tetratricopeptide (TPR) repeat protein